MKKQKSLKKIIADSLIVITAIILGGVSMFGLFGCGGKKFRVDYDGDKDFYKGAKDYYKAGEKVEVYYDFIATDTDYTFYLDGEYLNVGYEESKGFIIRFTMPEHDVKLTCESRNSMVYIPPIEPGTMLVDYYSAVVATVGGDRSDEMVLSYYDPVEAKLDVYSKSEIDGSESHKTYLVPYEAVDRCYDVIEEENFRSWENLKKSFAISGAVGVCKFREEDGSYTRVSTEKMPERGRASIDRVGVVMSEYISNENLIEEE